MKKCFAIALCAALLLSACAARTQVPALAEQLPLTGGSVQTAAETLGLNLSKAQDVFGDGSALRSDETVRLADGDFQWIVVRDGDTLVNLVYLLPFDGGDETAFENALSAARELCEKEGLKNGETYGDASLADASFAGFTAYSASYGERWLYDEGARGIDVTLEPQSNFASGGAALLVTLRWFATPMQNR